MTFWIRNVKFFYYQYKKVILFCDQKNIQKKLFRKPKFLDIKKKYLHIIVRNMLKQAAVPINGQIFSFVLNWVWPEKRSALRFFN